MLSALEEFFSRLGSWLIILKYVGLALAAGSSIWATVNVLTVRTVGGRKELTPAGIVAIGLTVLGLVISIISEDLQRRRTAEISKQQVAAEAKRTNSIIIAGQPLTSMSFSWSFSGLNPDILAELKKGEDGANAFIVDQQGERDSQQNGAVFRENQLYPFLLQLARHLANDTSSAPDWSVVALIALDDDPNSVIPFGQLDERVFSAWIRHAGKSSTASMLSVETESHAAYGNTDLQNWPYLETQDSDVTISWRLDPATFAKSIQRQNSFVVPTAKAPNPLRIAILFDISGLPFEPGNFALPQPGRGANFWNFPDYDDTIDDNFRGQLKPSSKNFTSTARLVPNSSSLLAFDYKLKQIYETLFVDTYGEASTDLRCVVFEYQLAE